MGIECEEEFTATQASKMLVEVAIGNIFIPAGGRIVKLKRYCSNGRELVAMTVERGHSSQSFCARNRDAHTFDGRGN